MNLILVTDSALMHQTFPQILIWKILHGLADQITKHMGPGKTLNSPPSATTSIQHFVMCWLCSYSTENIYSTC